MNILPILNTTPGTAVTRTGFHVIINNNLLRPRRRDDGTPLQTGDYHISNDGDDLVVWRCTSHPKNGTLRWSELTTDGGILLLYSDYYDLLESLTPTHPDTHALIIRKGRKGL